MRTQSDDDSKTKRAFELTIQALMFCYAVSLTFSMAAMEILGWVIVFAVGLYIVLYGRKKNSRIHIHSSGIEIPILLFIAVVAAGLLINAPSADFWYGFGRTRNLLLFVFVMWGFQFVGDFKKLFSIITLAASLVAIYAITQHWSRFDYWRHRILDPPYAVGLFNHHLTFAHAYSMLLCMPWAFLVISNSKNSSSRLKTYFNWGALTLIIASLYFSYSRGAWLSVICSLIFMSMLINFKNALKTLAVVACLIAAFTLFDNSFRNRMTSANLTFNTDRLNLWSANFKMFKDYPALGIGYRQNEGRTQEYFNKLGINSKFVGHAHNNYLDVLSTTGLLGFLCFLSIMIFPFIAGFRFFRSSTNLRVNYRMALLISLGAQIAFFIGGLTQNTWGDMKVQHQYFFWLALSSFVLHQPKSETNKTSKT